jgi:hypothetical protein
MRAALMARDVARYVSAGANYKAFVRSNAAECCTTADSPSTSLRGLLGRLSPHFETHGSPRRHAANRQVAPGQLRWCAAQLGWLQDDYECFFFIADWHALTTDYADTRSVKQNSLEVILDYLAAGLDPERSTLFIQSHVPQHAELHLLFSMITPLGWLERVPSYKEQRENLKDKDLGTYGFLGYPLLQSADILIYQANFVPVGEDQVPHVELTREVARDSISSILESCAGMS